MVRPWSSRPQRIVGNCRALVLCACSVRNIVVAGAPAAYGGPCALRWPPPAVARANLQAVFAEALTIIKHASVFPIDPPLRSLL